MTAQFPLAMLLELPVWRIVLLLLAAAPLAYYVVASLAAWRFFRRERAKSLPNFTPPVSILKPIRGVDFASYESFSSFCRQDYPDYEILFGVNDESDPSVPLIKRLQAEFPERNIRLFVGTDAPGANRKVAMLTHLAREARYDTLALTDGDVRVSATYLRESVAPFAETFSSRQNVGAVTSFYRSVAEDNFFAKIEAIGAASDFFAGVLVAEATEGVKFALGASIVTTKSWITQAGGLGAIADMLADDYELGHRIASAGGRVVISREVVATMYAAQSAGRFWRHQLRWARTVRLSRPVSYLGLIFTHGLPWTLLAAAVAPAKSISVAYLGAYLVLRFVMAWLVGVWGVRDETLRRNLWLIPVRDAIHFGVWLASFASNHIVWGDSEFLIREGRLIPLPNSNLSKSKNASPAS